jgi:putative membrane protein
MRSTLILLVSSAIALAACGQQEPAPEPAEVANDTAEPAPVVAAPTAQEFANTAAASDAFEIETSKVALDKSGSQNIKDFARKMIDAHNQSTAKLKTAAGAMTPPIVPDPVLTAAQQATLDNLKTASGAEFDAAYAAAQVGGHQAALDALQGYAAAGDNEAFKTLAAGLVPTVTEHFEMAKALRP